MKKLAVLLLMSIAAVGCTEESGKVTIAIEEGYTPDKEVTDAVENFYGGNIETVSVRRSEISSGKYDVGIGGVAMGDSMGYGIWKSLVLDYDNACVVSYDDYKMSSDLSGKKIGVIQGYDYSRYLSVDDECEYTNYSNTESMLSDIKNSAIDAVVCSAETAGELRKADDKLRVNDLLDSNVYEYVVVSEDIDLINSLDKVIK